jgi:hypothetical protein
MGGTKIGAISELEINIPANTPKASAVVSTPRTQASIAPLQQSMRLIESKLERIDNVIKALEGASFGGVGVEKLERIDRVMTALENSGLLNGTVNPFPVASTPAASVHIDSAEPPEGDSLVPVPDNQLSIQEAARIEFGRHLVTMVNVKQVDLKAARSLPPSSFTNNSFRNSYLYKHDTNELFIHTNRLSSSGDFGLVVIHALSHIKVNIILYLFQL